MFRLLYKEKSRDHTDHNYHFMRENNDDDYRVITFDYKKTLRSRGAGIPGGSHLEESLLSRLYSNYKLQVPFENYALEKKIDQNVTH